MKTNAKVATQPNTIRGLSADQVWDYENGYYWFSNPARRGKMLAHYELYKEIRNLPGDVFELGVYKGASLVRLATFRGMFESDHSRRIVGFDAFGKFPTEKLSLEADTDFIGRFEEQGGDGLEKDEVAEILFGKGFTNVTLVKGNVFETLPDYIKKNPQTRISFLHLDMDVKEPTLFALEDLYDRVVPGGLIVLDDYNAVAGATDATDAFIKGKGLKIEKLPFYNVPAFIRKPC